MNPTQIATVISVLEKRHPDLSTRLKEAIPPLLFKKEYALGEMILCHKAIQDCALLILTGSAMEVWINALNEQESASNFWFQHDFPYTQPGLFSQKPSPAYIRTMEPTVCAAMTFDDLQRLKAEFKEAELLIEQVRAQYDEARRIYEEDFHFPAQYRVKKLETLHPNIYQLADLQHIADYHKINVRTLNRIRKELLK